MFNQFFFQTLDVVFTVLRLLRNVNKQFLFEKDVLVLGFPPPYFIMRGVGDVRGFYFLCFNVCCNLMSFFLSLSLSCMLECLIFHLVYLLVCVRKLYKIEHLLNNNVEKSKEFFYKWQKMEINSQKRHSDFDFSKLI